MASRARTCAVTGSVISLVSWPDQPSPSPQTPTCVCASTKPGSTQPPSASTTSAPRGGLALVPTAVMRPALTTTVPSYGSPSIGTTWALVIASVLLSLATGPL